MGYGYGGSYSDYSNSNGCDCSTLFKHIARGEHVKVILKGGGKIKGEFVDVRGNCLVRKQHELLDQFMRVLPDFRHHSQGLPFFVKLKFYFSRFKIYGTLLETFFTKFMSKFIQSF